MEINKHYTACLFLNYQRGVFNPEVNMMVLLLTISLWPQYLLGSPNPFPKTGRSPGLFNIPSDSALWHPYKHHQNLTPIPTMFTAPSNLQGPSGTSAEEKNVSIFLKKHLTSQEKDVQASVLLLAFGISVLITKTLESPRFLLID